MSGQTSEQKNRPNYTKWLGVGTEFGGVIAVFCYIGYKVDIALDTSPYFLLAGFFFSFIGMLYMVIKQTRPRRGESRRAMGNRPAKGRGLARGRK